METNTTDTNEVKKALENNLRLKNENINCFVISDKTYFYEIDSENLEKYKSSKNNSKLLIKSNNNILMKCIKNEGLPFLSNPLIKGNLFINYKIIYPNKISDKIKDQILNLKFQESFNKQYTNNEYDDKYNVEDVDTNESYLQNKIESDSDEETDEIDGQPQCNQQ